MNVSARWTLARSPQSRVTLALVTLSLVAVAVLGAGLAASFGFGQSGAGVKPTSASSSAASSAAPSASSGATPSTITRGTFVRRVRLHGLIEAVQFYSVISPRLTGGGNARLTIVKLVPKGTMVRQGDLLVEFDRQQPVREAMDKRAEFLDLEEQIRKKQADQAASRAADETQLKSAENAVATAKLEVLKNELLPRIEAEKNRLNLEAAEAKLAQLKKTLALRQTAAAADLEILKVRRDRASNTLKHAERNAERMAIRSPIDGLVVLKSFWRQGQMAEPQEGEELWPGMPVMDVVGSNKMRVRVKVNQADLPSLAVGQSAVVTLDAYPGKSYPARLEQIAPVGQTSQFSPKVRSFIAMFELTASDPQLAPDLSAAVDVEVERQENALLAPREAIEYREGNPYLRVRRGSSTDLQEVTLGAMNDRQVVVASGIESGVQVETLTARRE